jgi:hypothetical protein
MAHSIVLASEDPETARRGTTMLFRLPMACHVTPHVFRMLESTVADGTLVGFFLGWIVGSFVVSRKASVDNHPHCLYALVSLYARSCLEGFPADRADVRCRWASAGERFSWVG